MNARVTSIRALILNAGCNPLEMHQKFTEDGFALQFVSITWKDGVRNPQLKEGETILADWR